MSILPARERSSLPAPWRLEIHDSLPSTSDHLMARAAEGEADGLAVMALRQTAPRATRGRAWTEPEGNLALSLLIRPSAEGESSSFNDCEPGLWALAVGLAVFDAVLPYVPDAGSLFLKWPNDIMLEGGKLGGILIDAAMGRNGPDWLVAGIGVNIAAAPQVPGRETACLARVCALPPAPHILAERIVTRLSAWRHAATLEIRDAWRRAAHPPGTRLTVSHRGEALQGTFLDIGEDGALLLDCAGERKVVHTGDVLLAPGQAAERSSH